MIKLHADSHFRIGKTHLNAGKPNQDYAITKIAKDGAMAIVSDGCSSGGRTDIGSRLIANYMLAHADGHNFFRWYNHRREMRRIQRQLGLQTEDLLATCAYVMVSSGSVIAEVQGDGVIAVKYRNGKIHAWRYEWDDNMPFYPAYDLDPKYRKAFVELHGGDKETRLHVENWTFWEEGIRPHLFTEHYSVSTGMNGSFDTLMYLGDLNKDADNIEYLAVFSDGVAQIEGLNWKKAVSRLMSFKSATGEFVKRRLNGEIRRIEKNGNSPLDDIAMAVIRVEHNEEGG